MNSKSRSIISRLPDFYTRDEGTTLALFVQLFGRVIEEVEADLLAVMHAHWVDKADNAVLLDFEAGDQGDLDRLFAIYLDSLGGTSQLKQANRPPGAQGLADDARYRERIKGLIKVLMRGASTREGIKAVVAANLGIVENKGDTPERQALVRAARDMIRIVEFAPDANAGTNYALTLYEAFAVTNPNPSPITPQFRLTFRSDLPFPLTNLRLINNTSDQSLNYSGQVDQGDVLALFADGSALLNGVTVPVTGVVPPAAPGTTTWQIEAEAVRSGQPLPIGRFDVSAFNLLPPDHPRPPVWMFSEPALDLNLTLTKLTPGFFAVYIPWDIPGFTDKFEELPDHPRTQIGYIIDKVKAAGVGTAIVYEKMFTELHAMVDQLTILGETRPFAEDIEMEEFNFDIGSVQMPYAGGLDQELDDRFIASGAFDMTTFDSLNTFAD
ncbi:MAG: hypothetical protein IPK19_10835 [Chloroflexi bacterium]|nr:hypothetical protein [Chloroflexota bacterium]